MEVYARDAHRRPLCRDGYYEQLIGEWEEEMEGYRAIQETEQMFREGQGDDLPPCSQDFYEYWHDGPHIEDFSWLCRPDVD